MLNTKAQATVEYILIFAFMSLIGIGIAGAISEGLSSSVKSLGFRLTQELSTGVCKTRCFYSGYINEVSD